MPWYKITLTIVADTFQQANFGNFFGKKQFLLAWQQF
jgi:hypothetical protein